MSVQKLERVLWRVRRYAPDTNRPTWTQLKRAIMYECGTDPKTYTAYRKALITLGWIKTERGRRFRLTNKDLEE